LAMTSSLRRFLFSSLSVWFLISILGIYFIVHLKKFINFGIDLVGGTYITLEVKIDKAIENELAEKVQAVFTQIKKNYSELPVYKIVDSSAFISCLSEAQARDVEAAIMAYDSRLEVSRNGLAVTVQLSSQAITTLKHDAVQGNINVLRTRLDKFGVGEITIAAQGESSIIVELPNVHNPQQAKAMIGKAALLELKLVEDAADSEEHLLARHSGMIPDGFTVVRGASKRGNRGEVYLVPQYTDLTGRLLKDAQMDPAGGRFGTEPVVKFVFKPEGGEKFYELSSNNLGRRVAIIVDGLVITAPTLQSAISTQGEITGDFTPAEAQELAMLLKSGAFVAPVTFEEERHIGPSLGQESIKQGLMACVVALTLLLAFSVLVYKVAGLFAFIVLIYNLLLILFMLAMLGATLTLPGIAGIILTIGMAIDASILIYERIREELASGASLRKAVDTGFSGATAVILDANITHFIVAVVLYKLGAGPIQGFAVTMIIGIISTLITGLILLKTIFSFMINNLNIRTLKI
jgi:preprotein translocase subunit SecD